jgi:hypothetical protein
VVTWKEGLASFLCVLREVHVERDTSRVHADVVQRDFFALAHVSSSRPK